MDWQTKTRANSRRGLFQVLGYGFVIFLILLAAGRMTNAAYMASGAFFGKRCNCLAALGRLRDSAFATEVESLNAITSPVLAIRSHTRSTYLSRGGCGRC